MDEDALRRIETLEKQITDLQRQLAASKVQQALMDDRLLTLERNRLFRLWSKLYRAAARIYGRMGLDDQYGGLSDLRTRGDYARWVNREQWPLESPDVKLCVSILMDAGRNEANFRASLQSVLEQSYPHWELCLACEGKAPPWLGLPQAQARILEDCGDSPLERGAAVAKGEFLLVLRAGDRLSPYALRAYAQAHRQAPAASLLYSDEDHIDSDGNRTAPWFKPGWSPELLQATPYLGRSILYRREIFPNAEAEHVVHVPRVLYHRADGVVPSTASRTPQYQPPADAKITLIVCSRQLRQVRECLRAVQATRTLPIEILVVEHMQAGNSNAMRHCVEKFGGASIPYTGSFDFARMNNLAAAQATSPYLLFMNDDVIVRQPGWDQAIAATLAQPQIGIAGTILEYPDGTIQHAGVVVGMGDAAGHCGRFQKASELWPWLRMSRDVSAVTGAMLGIRADLFQQMKGFDEAFPINYNDVDLCLRVRRAGMRVVCLNVGTVVHRESQTRIGGTRYPERDALYQRWPDLLSQPDEFYSPHLAPTERIALNLEETDHPLTGLA